jgi:hypothetical protein
MLRITIHDLPESLTFKFEGKLVGPWVREAQESWQRTRGPRPKASQRFDLTEVTVIDAAGKAFLVEAHAKGVQLIASGCAIRAIVAELTKTPVPR